MAAPNMTLWRIGPEDWRPLLLIALLPLLVALPFWLGFLDADPAMSIADMASVAHGQSAIGLAIRQPGASVIDDNVGQTTQALGYRAVLEILHGHMPWWNTYSGVGMPLAAEYQPAAFFPLTFLLLLPQGMLLEHLFLQILAGWGTYALLRQLGINRFAALTGGALYAFNGTLAWFGDGAALPLPFLPWMLFGIERVRMKAELGLRDGWRIFAVALALSLLGGFPEAAYLDGLMALAWAVLRLCQIPRPARWVFVRRMAMGGVVGVLLAAPQIFAFFHYLQNGVVSAHGASLADFKLVFADAIPSLIAPYFFGPIDGPFPGDFLLMLHLGGFVSVAVLVVAVYGLFAKREPLAWLLAGWTLLALGKMFGLQPAAWLWNLVPGSTLVLVSRYIQPTWLLAMVILVAVGLDDLDSGPRRRALLGAGIAALVAAGSSLAWAATHWTGMYAVVGIRYWFLGSLIWIFASVLFCMGTLWWPGRRKSAMILGAFLIGESALLFAIPTLSNPVGGTTLDMAAVDFLRGHLGLNRFHTLGPIQPNYGAYFGVASIDETSSPAPTRWAEWLPHLDVAARIDDMTGGFRTPAQPTPLQELHRNLAAFEWAGVKYVLAEPDQAPELAAELKLAAVYSDDVMSIYELPHPSPYFEVIKGLCKVVSIQRTDVMADCATPAILLRRELFYPGWSARVNRADAPIALYKDLFQTISLPQGRSSVRFAYAPPHIIWMWLAVWLGLIGLVVPSRHWLHAHYQLAISWIRQQIALQRSLFSSDQ